MTKCGHCGAPAYISDANADAGAEVYCSEACAKGDRPAPPPAPDCKPTDYGDCPPEKWSALWPPFQW